MRVTSIKAIYINGLTGSVTRVTPVTSLSACREEAASLLDGRCDFLVEGAELPFLMSRAVFNDKLMHGGGERVLNCEVTILLKKRAPSAFENSLPTILGCYPNPA